MNKINIVYWSGTGNTEIMANKIMEGAEEIAEEVSIFTTQEFNISKLKNADIIVFGCPSMGSETLEESEFEPMFESCKSQIEGKQIALFGSYGWGEGEWMRNWEKDVEDAGAILVCKSLIINETPDSQDKEKCYEFGNTLI